MRRGFLWLESGNLREQVKNLEQGCLEKVGKYAIMGILNWKEG